VTEDTSGAIESSRRLTDARPRRRYAIWGREIPFRNPHFTGRTKELEALRRRLNEGSPAVLGQPPQPLYGLGGVGKTEIAAEYAHRFRDDYDLVWWIRAEQADTIINALIALGQQLSLPDFRAEERDYSAGVVIAALSQGQPYANWLLIFDNATNAELIGKYIPRGPGHVIITSRDSRWRKALRTDGIQVSEFEPAETIEFLRKRVPALGFVEPGPDTDARAQRTALEGNAQREKEAAALARQLANLPLAAEHAAAYLVETGRPVNDYLNLFEQNAHMLLGDDVDIPYPHPVATTWRVSRATISTEADALFQLLAFFSPEPISAELLIQPGRVKSVPEELTSVLKDPSEFRRAARELARFSLVKIDGVRNVLQVHRVVQAVTKGRLKREDPDATDRYREAAHALLAASDPLTPDRDDSDPIYERSRQHLIPSGALESADPSVQGLIINQVRRLDRRGGHNEALSLGEAALKIWKKQFGPNDRHSLALAVEVGVAMRHSGRWQEALELNADTLARLRTHFGDNDQASLTCARSYGADLTMLGRYTEALDNDLGLLPLYEEIFRPEHPDTLQLRNNIAVSMRCLGKFDEALSFDQETLAERERILGFTDTGTLISRWAVARTLRRLGRYEEALSTVRDVCETLDEKGEPWNPFRLLAAADLQVSLRRVGYYRDALREGEAALDRHISILGEHHRQTLLVATNLISDRRLVEDFSGAQELGEQTVLAWEKVVGADHPNTIGARANLAVALHARNNPLAARKLNEDALQDFISIFGDRHPSPLVVMMNLASDLAASGDINRAREVGEHALELSREVRGVEHPVTLAAAANLSVDRQADGDAAGARDLYEETIELYRRVLGTEHPEYRLALQRGRVTVDIDLMIV
jgi:tetratricopeptide (TPR) repeat protein